MRRKDRGITDRAEIEAILNEAMVCRIGLADSGEPYIVPLSFGYEDGAVYIHSAPEASKNLPGSLKTFRSSRISSLMTFDTSPVSSLAEFDGKKITMIRKNPRCCFEVDICDQVIRGDKPYSWGMRYRSVIGYGRVPSLRTPKKRNTGSTALCATTVAAPMNFQNMISGRSR